MLNYLPCAFPLAWSQCDSESFLLTAYESVIGTKVWNARLHLKASAPLTHASTYGGSSEPSQCPQSQTAIKRQGDDCVKMALKEPGAQQAGPISVKVAADDSQFSQPIIGVLIYAQRGHSHPLTNQRRAPEVSHDDKSVQDLSKGQRETAKRTNYSNYKHARSKEERD